MRTFATAIDTQICQSVGTPSIRLDDVKALQSPGEFDLGRMTALAGARHVLMLRF
jgi:hypothetical protein